LRFANATKRLRVIERNSGHARKSAQKGALATTDLNLRQQVVSR